MANENQSQRQPEVKTTVTADEKRKVESAKVRCVVASGSLIGGDPDDETKQRVYTEGESLDLPQKQADELRESGFVIFTR